MNKAITRISGYAWFIWAVASFFYLFIYILRVSPSVMMPGIMQKFSVSAEDFGYFSAIYYLGYTLMHIPFGILLDRFKVNVVIACAIGSSVIGLIPLVYMNDWHWVLIGRFFVGAGSTGAILAVFKVTSSFFPKHLFSRMLGISVTIGVLGAIYGSSPIDKLSREFGWEYVTSIIIATGLAIAFIIFFFKSKQETTKNENKDNVLHSLKTVCANKRVIALALFAGFMVGPLEGFADVWAVSFLQNVYDYSREMATSLPTIIFIGMCIGSSTLPTIAEKLKAYYQTVIVCGIIMLVIFLIMLTMHPTPSYSIILFIILGVCSSYQIIAIYLNSQNVAPTYQGLTTAVTNMIIMVFGSVFHSVIGKVMQANWDGKMIDNVAIYPTSSYITSLSVIPAGLLIGTIGIFCLKPRKEVKKKEI
jgi:predicted MFS family arabinose efflux permease